MLVGHAPSIDLDHHRINETHAEIDFWLKSFSLLSMPTTTTNRAEKTKKKRKEVETLYSFSALMDDCYSWRVHA